MEHELTAVCQCYRNAIPLIHLRQAMDIQLHNCLWDIGIYLRIYTMNLGMDYPDGYQMYVADK